MASLHRTRTRSIDQGSEQIVEGLGAAYHGKASVRVKEKLCGTQLTIVVEPHRVSMRTGIVNDDDIIFLQSWQIPLYREFVVVLTE